MNIYDLTFWLLYIKLLSFILMTWLLFWFIIRMRKIDVQLKELDQRKTKIDYDILLNKIIFIEELLSNKRKK